MAVITNALSNNQIQWKFIADDDKPSDAPIIEFEDDFKYRFGEIVTEDAQAICQLIPKSPLVFDNDGNLPEGVFVRKYLNGDYIVVNVKGNAGRYVINGKQFDLEKNGVLISTFSIKNYTQTLKQEIGIKFDIEYGSRNITRVLYSDFGEATIYCDSDKSIVFAIRNGESIVVNGEKIIGSNPTYLTAGFKDLYSDSHTIVLKKGINTIKANNDFCFMPTAFIMGDFYALHDTDNNTVKLLDRKSKLSIGERFEEYGFVEFKSTVTVPNRANCIMLKGTKLFTRVYINDELVGEGIASPYIYDVNKFSGQNVNLKIVQYSSMASMFGDSDKFSRRGGLVSKKIQDDELLFGFDNIYFV